MVLMKLIIAWNFQNVILRNSHPHVLIKRMIEGPPLIEVLETLARPMMHGRISQISEDTKLEAYPSTIFLRSHGPSITHHRTPPSKAIKKHYESSLFLKNYSFLRSRPDSDNSKSI